MKLLRIKSEAGNAIRNASAGGEGARSLSSLVLKSRPDFATGKITSPEDLGHMIKMRRIEIGMSQEDLASMTGVSQPNLSKIERGQTAATLDTYLRLLTALGIDLIGRPRS